MGANECDINSLDIPNKKLEVKLSAEEIAKRRAGWTAPEPRMNYGWLGRYQKMVTNAASGAVLKNLRLHEQGGQRGELATAIAPDGSRRE